MTGPHDLAESDLTRALRAAFSQPDFRGASLSGKEGADELLAEVEASAHQVFLARKYVLIGIVIVALIFEISLIFLF